MVLRSRRASGERSPWRLSPPVLRLLETKKPILVASASVCAPQDPWPLVAAELDTAGHQSFVSASCSCDNRLLRVITIPVTIRLRQRMFVAQKRLPPVRRLCSARPWRGPSNCPCSIVSQDSSLTARHSPATPSATARCLARHAGADRDCRAQPADASIPSVRDEGIIEHSSSRPSAQMATCTCLHRPSPSRQL